MTLIIFIKHTKTFILFILIVQFLTAKPLFKLPTIAFTKHSGKYNVTRNSNTILKENVPSAIFKGIDPSTPINENNTTPLTQPRLGNADKNYSINVTSVPKLRSNGKVL